MTIYRHTQVGTLVLPLIGVPIIALIVSMLVGEYHPVLLFVLVVLFACLILFATLTVEVSTTAVQLHFGPGLVRKSFSLSNIHQVSRVRNRWFYGWGIRRLPHGWLYNVSGLDAVELELSDGGISRIGTDEPRELLAAIEAARLGAHS